MRQEDHWCPSLAQLLINSIIRHLRAPLYSTCALAPQPRTLGTSPFSHSAGVTDTLHYSLSHSRIDTHIHSHATSTTSKAHSIHQAQTRPRLLKLTNHAHAQSYTCLTATARDAQAAVGSQERPQAGPLCQAAAPRVCCQHDHHHLG